MAIHKLCISYWRLRRWNDRWNNYQGRIQLDHKPVFNIMFLTDTFCDLYLNYKLVFDKGFRVIYHKGTQTESKKASNWFSLSKKCFVYLPDPLYPNILNRCTYSRWKSYTRLVEKRKHSYFYFNSDSEQAMSFQITLLLTSFVYLDVINQQIPVFQNFDNTPMILIFFVTVLVIQVALIVGIVLNQGFYFTLIFSSQLKPNTKKWN